MRRLRALIELILYLLFIALVVYAVFRLNGYAVLRCAAWLGSDEWYVYPVCGFVGFLTVTLYLLLLVLVIRVLDWVGGKL